MAYPSQPFDRAHKSPSRQAVRVIFGEIERLYSPRYYTPLWRFHAGSHSSITVTRLGEIQTRQNQKCPNSSGFVFTLVEINGHPDVWGLGSCGHPASRPFIVKAAAPCNLTEKFNSNFVLIGSIISMVPSSKRLAGQRHEPIDTRYRYTVTNQHIHAQLKRDPRDSR
jgi:hypothetical protein